MLTRKYRLQVNMACTGCEEHAKAALNSIGAKICASYKTEARIMCERDSFSSFGSWKSKFMAFFLVSLMSSNLLILFVLRCRQFAQYDRNNGTFAARWLE